jgi:hypothetical protein
MAITGWMAWQLFDRSETAQRAHHSAFDFGGDAGSP